MSPAYLLLTALCFSVESTDLNVAIDAALARDRTGHAPLKIADDFEFCTTCSQVGDFLAGGL